MKCNMVEYQTVEKSIPDTESLGRSNHAIFEEEFGALQAAPLTASTILI
jgi:hypothetical protein